MSDQSQLSIRQATIQDTMRRGLYVGILLSADIYISTSTSVAMKILHFLVVAYIIVYTYRALREFVTDQLQNEYSFWRSFAYTLNLFFYASLIAALFSIIYYKYLNPTYLESTIEQLQPMMDKLMASSPGYSPDMLKSLFTPEQMAMYLIIGQCFYGMVLGALYYPVLKINQKNEPQQ